MEEVAADRLEMVQFHQSYSYEDFVRDIVQIRRKQDPSFSKMGCSISSANAQKQILIIGMYSLLTRSIAGI